MLHAEDDAQQHDVCELQPVAVFVLAEQTDEVIGKPAPEYNDPLLILHQMLLQNHVTTMRVCSRM